MTRSERLNSCRAVHHSRTRRGDEIERVVGAERRGGARRRQGSSVGTKPWTRLVLLERRLADLADVGARVNVLRIGSPATGLCLPFNQDRSTPSR